MAIYIIIYIFLFSVFLIQGRNIFHHKASYWKYSIFPIIAFSLIEGSRYMRGIDYSHYALFYSNPELMPIKEDFGFEILNNALRTISTEPQFAFTIYALITIVCLFIFAKQFVEVYKIIFLLMLVFTIHSSEWIVRQFISIAIMYAAIYYLTEKRYKIFFIFSLCSVCIHYSSIFFLTITLLCYLFLKKPIKWQITVPIITIVMLFSSANLIADLISKILNAANLSFLDGSSYVRYVEKSDQFLDSQAAGTVTGNRSIFTTLLNLFFYISLFVEGYHVLCKKKLYNVFPFFNLCVIGYIGKEFFLKYELFVRLFRPMELLVFIPVSYIIINKNLCRFKMTYLYIVLYTILIAGRFIFFPLEDYYYFIWTK